MKMKCDNFKLDVARRDAIVEYKKKYGDSALSSKDVVFMKLQIGAHAPKVLILHSAPARGVFGFKEGEIGFSGEEKHHKNFEFEGEEIPFKRLVDFNIFIEAFDHPASARFVRLFWQMTREAKELSKLIEA